MCQYARTVEQIFQNFAVKIFGEFFKFYIWTVSGTAGGAV